MALKEHLDLSDFIKSVHLDLRVKSKEIGYYQAWSDHCQNEILLQKYASAMKTLATNHWMKCDNSNESSQSRIEWVVTHCNRYFFLGDLQEEVEKEMALAEKHEIEYDKMMLEKLKGVKKTCNLLDVGSCYNPFKQFEQFNVTAIDLCPATEDVIKCDFLNAQISLNKSDNILCSELYDIVVFSLFLEYLPSSEQRYCSCKKAYKLLKPTGLLFILTPDSKHATANSKLMKSWRICLASVGFTRVYYEKLKHLHGMAFKKTCIKELPLRWFELKNTSFQSAPFMMNIPQDFLTLNQNSNKLNSSEEYQLNPEDIAKDFNALPQGDDLI